MYKYTELEVAEILAAIAETVPEIMETEEYKEHTPAQIETWDDWISYERDGEQENKILGWLQQEFSSNGLELSLTTLGGGLIGLEVAGDRLHALVTTDYGLGIYVNADSDLAIASQRLEDAKENFACPRTFVRVMATVIKLTVLGGKW